MSLRGIWVIGTQGSSVKKLLFSRIYPTVEKRAKCLDGENYVPVTDGDTLSQNIVYELVLGTSSKNVPFSAARDACDRPDQKPVLHVKTAAGELWPLLVIEQGALLFCCLPLVEQGTHTRPPLYQIQGISSGFSLLLGMIEFLGHVPKNIDASYSKLGDLALFVGEAAPLGFPIDTNPHSVRAALQGRVAPAPKRGEKQAAWRPVNHKGRSQIHFTVKEHIRVAMYDKPDIPDVWDVYGTVSCKAELEGTLPEVTFSLSPTDTSRSVPLDHVITHPYVQNLDPQSTAGVSQGEEGSMAGCRLRVMPPLESVTLCHYTANAITEPPIHGFYQMKGEKKVEVLLQLKLSQHVKNNFEYCELQLPFHHRGQIISHESNPTHGSILLSPDKKVLVWNIGQKFPQRTLEVQLKSTIQFARYTLPEPESGSAEQMFCIGQNCFAQLFFKINGYTLTGVSVDPKTIQVSPNLKYKTSFDTEMLSGDYRIWNSHGDVPSAFTPSPLLISEMQNFPSR